LAQAVLCKMGQAESQEGAAGTSATAKDEQVAGADKKQDTGGGTSKESQQQAGANPKVSGTLNAGAKEFKPTGWNLGAPAFEPTTLASSVPETVQTNLYSDWSNTGVAWAPDLSQEAWMQGGYQEAAMYPGVDAYNNPVWSEGAVTSANALMSTAPVINGINSLPIPPPPSAEPTSKKQKGRKKKESPRTAILTMAGAWGAISQNNTKLPRGAVAKSVLLNMLPFADTSVPVELKSLKCIAREA